MQNTLNNCNVIFKYTTFRFREVFFCFNLNKNFVTLDAI